MGLSEVIISVFIPRGPVIVQEEVNDLSALLLHLRGKNMEKSSQKAKFTKVRRLAKMCIDFGGTNTNNSRSKGSHVPKSRINHTLNSLLDQVHSNITICSHASIHV